MEKYESILKILASKDYYKAKELIKHLNNKELFIKIMISISNPYIYDRFTKMFEYQMDISAYYEERNDYIKKILINQTNSKILDYFDGTNPSNYGDYLLTEDEINSLSNAGSFFDDKIERISNRWLNEYIISYFFQDNFYNYMINFYQMVHYIDDVKKNIVSRDHIYLYKEFSGLNNMSFSEKISLFKKHMNNSYSDIFYDDMRKTRDDAYQELVNSSLKLNHDSPIYCKEISKSFGINIYYLNGEEFNAFVKCFSIDKSDLSSDYSRYFFEENNRLGHSFTYIGNKDISTIDYDKKGVTLLYDDIDYQKIMYVHHSDLHSKKMNMQDDYLTDKINEILTPNSLLIHTRNYNEIYIVGKPKPKALVCYDTITKEDIAFATKYKLSIVLINQEKYKQYQTYDEDYMDNTYIL